jgi:aminoglycoside phosphotransferase (APT) family kinase protein
VLDQETGRKLAQALIDNLAVLHALDLETSGLSELGHPEGYVARQVRGWAARYAAARTDALPELEWAFAELAARVPPERGAALVHNDYKHDNVVLDPADLTRIRAGARLGDGDRRRSVCSISAPRWATGRSR